MINVCYILDENYLVPTIVSATSVILNHDKRGKNLHIFFICQDCRKETLEFLRKVTNQFQTKECKVTILEIDISDFMQKTNCNELNINASSAALIKFFLPEILVDLEKVLYLDGDTVSVKDIEEFYNEDINDYYLGAVICTSTNLEEPSAEIAEKELGVDKQRFFNSGVMLMNLNSLRKNNVVEKLCDYRINGKNFFMDQCALNVVCANYTKSLDVKYNFRTIAIFRSTEEEIKEKLKTDFSTFDELLRAQVIVHFIWKKPWIYDVPFSTRLFMEYYNKSPLADIPLKLKMPEELMQKNIRENKAIQKNLQYFLDVYKRNKKWKILDNIPQGSNVVIYGMGDVGKQLLNEITEDKKINVVALIDVNKANEDSEICTPDILKTIDYDYVIIATIEEKNYMEIAENLEKLKVLKDKIISVLEPIVEK